MINLVKNRGLNLEKTGQMIRKVVREGFFNFAGRRSSNIGKNFKRLDFSANTAK